MIPNIEQELLKQLLIKIRNSESNTEFLDKVGVLIETELDVLIRQTKTSISNHDNNTDDI